MDRFSELLHELAQAERHLAEGQARIARQAEFVRELGASGHDMDFSAKRLMVMAANLNEMRSTASRPSARCRPLRREQRPPAALIITAVLAIAG